MSCSNFKEYRLDEVYDFSSGLSKSRKEFGFGYPFLTFKDVFYNYFVPKELVELANTTEKERIRCSIKRGDVFLTRTSETVDELGKSSVALNDYPEATFNGFTKRLRPNGKIEILPEYAGYYFRSPKFRSEINSMAIMTTRASLNNDMMSRLKIVIPSIENQKFIANILSSLDKKIELNNEMNKTLEEMAQALFKRWFIDFEFPNEEGKPYKSSGGEMVESDMGMIPKGWKVKKINQVSINYDSKRKPLSSREREKREKIYPYYGAASLMDYVDDYLFDGTYILMGEDGTVVDELGYPILQYIWGKFWVNNHAHVLSGREDISNEFIYLFLKNTNVLHLVTGAVQPKINQKNLNSLDVIVPDLNILQKFNNNIKIIFEEKKVLINSTQYLTELRDTLLPKLMSGEIRVNDIEANL